MIILINPDNSVNCIAKDSAKLCLIGVTKIEQDDDQALFDLWDEAKQQQRPLLRDSQGGYYIPDDEQLAEFYGTLADEQAD